VLALASVVESLSVIVLFSLCFELSPCARGKYLSFAVRVQ